MVRDSIHIGNTFDLYSLSGVNIPTLLASGANVTWDLSSATASLAGTGALLDISSTPYGSQYPAANFAIKFSSGGNDVYSLFNLTSTIMEEVGNNVSTSGGVGFDNPRTALVFPFTFGLSNTDNYQKSGQGTKTIVNTYDSYGTFKANGKTYTDVIRILTVDDGDTSLTYWTSSPANPLFTANSNGFSLFQPSSATGIVESGNTGLFNLYPNPATNELKIITGQHILQIEIYNVEGALQVTAAKPVINISDLPPGVYMIRAISSEGVATQKFVKN